MQRDKNTESSSPLTMTPTIPSPRMSFNLQQTVKALSIADWLVVGGSVVFLIASILPWYTVSINFLGVRDSQSWNAW